MNGFINVLKPPGMTSHDVVYYVRKISGEKRCGHTGTLDPGASGVLPVALGKATRLSRFVTEGNKTYRAEMTLGISTTTQDAFGEVVSINNGSHLGLSQLTEVLQNFTGTISQTPPMSSAIKVQGKKLYELEREGKVVEVPTRIVNIFKINIIDSWDWKMPHPRVLFDVTCSKGTYVRTLCSDIGKALGCGAYMSFLLRSRVGEFHLENASTLEELKDSFEAGTYSDILLPVAQALGDLAAVYIHQAAHKSVSSGASLYPAGVRRTSREIYPNELVKIYFNDELLGVYKSFEDVQDEKPRIIYKPEVVLVS